MGMAYSSHVPRDLLRSGAPTENPAEVPAAASTRVERLIELSGRIQRTLGIARTLVDGGRILDLTGIDDGIGILCAQTLDLDTGEARVMLPYLNAVLAQADGLWSALRRCGEEA